MFAPSYRLLGFSANDSAFSLPESWPHCSRRRSIVRLPSIFADDLFGTDLSYAETEIGDDRWESSAEDARRGIGSILPQHCR